MKVSGIYKYNSYVPNRNSVQKFRNEQEIKIRQQLKFGSVGGKFWGGLFGASAASIGTVLALATGPVGWLAGLTYVTACVGGGVIGAKAGDKITGEDKE